MSKILKIAVISDLHCTQKDIPRGKITNLHTTMPSRPSNRNPVEAFRKLILEKEIQADILLCPGDITDQVNEQGFYSGWSYLEEMGKFLNVKNIYATLGNHDIASRLEKPNDAFKIAQNLKYNFPLPEAKQQTEFWGEKFSIIETDDFRLFIYNSVNDHYNSEASKKVGIDAITIDKISEALEKSDSNKIGIAMTHHHPINHYSTDFTDSDFIDKGDLLLKVLEKHSFKLFVHGHKHEPMLRINNGIPILSSGSFSCLENLKETESENLFHIIEIQNNKGIIKSWEYGPINGWHQKKSNTSFPNLTGFGFFGTIEDLAKDINDWLNSKGTGSSNLKLLSKDIPDIYHIYPENQKKLEKILSENYLIQITPGIYFGDKANINKIYE